MKKIIFNVLFLGFVFIGFAAPKNAVYGDELWTDIKSIEDFIGRWEGYTVVSIPPNKDVYMPKTSIEMNISFEYIRGSEDVNGVMKVDLNKILNDWAGVKEIKEAGFTKDVLWEMLAQEFEQIENIIIGGRYFLTYNLSDKAASFFSADENGKFQINKDGNKVKLIFFEAVSFGLGDSGITEIILNRK